MDGFRFIGRLGWCLVGALVLVACASGQAPPSAPATPQSTIPADGARIANPASTNCIEKGGKLDIVRGQGGETGICKFPDGSQCEEWAFFRGECRPGQVTPQPSPATRAGMADLVARSVPAVKGTPRQET